MKWKTLEHNGPAFSAEYEYKNYPVKVKDKPITLNWKAEEMLYHWAAKTGTPYVEDKTFCRNFFKELKTEIHKGMHSTRFPEDWDVSAIYKAILDKREANKNKTREEKEAAKDVTANRKLTYGWAVIDGKEMEIANYIVEPPGIFMGRGKNPLRGRWKPRVTSEDITLNLGKKAPMPKGNWKYIEHNQDAIWLSFWRDKLTDNYKYVMLSPKASVRQEKDIAKFDNAMLLMEKMPEAIDFINSCIKSGTKYLKVDAIACSLIAHTGIRVGDEKDEDEAATYGATTLLKKHVEIKDKYVYFNFLGKDSILYKEKVELPELTINALKKLIEFKKPDDQIFPNTTSQSVNMILNKFMPGVTAKVFRTAIATAIMQNYLNQNKNKKMSQIEKIKVFKEANILVALKLNHRKTPTEAAKNGLKNKKAKLKQYKIELKELKETSVKEIEKNLKIKQLMVKGYKKKYKNSKLREAVARANKTYKSKKTRMERKVKRLQYRVERLSFQVDLQSKTMDLNLGTALASYVNPRVTFKWAKEVNLSLQHIYTKANVEKYNWTT